MLLLAVAREADRGESLERADVGGRSPAVVNQHLEHLAALGFVTTGRVFGQKYRTAALTAAGRAWLDDHRDELELMDGAE